MTDTIRWDRKPSYSLKAAAACRELSDVRPSITPWGNAMRLELDHQAEVAAILGASYRGADRRLAVR